MVAPGLVSCPLKHPYKQSPLPNGEVDWVPILTIQVARGSFLTAPFEAIIDSGSTDCLFHGDIAKAVGITDLTTGVHSLTGGVVGGAQMDLYAHEVRLLVGSDNFKVTGQFSDQLPIGCLLGRRGFFDKFVITFNPTEPNPGFELTRIHKRK
jgi:hypothetical protein